jgi:hypothetical protein
VTPVGFLFCQLFSGLAFMFLAHRLSAIMAGERAWT